MSAYYSLAVNQTCVALVLCHNCSVTESSSSSSESDEGSTSDNSDSDKSDSATGSKCPWKLGPDYQAALPELQQLPQGGLPPAEAKYLRPPVFTPAAPGASSSSGSRPFTGDTLAPGVFRKMWGQAASGPARVQLLEGWLNKMDQHMGQQLAQVSSTILGTVVLAVTV